MNALKNLPLLIKREYWEHRGGFLWAPFWTCAVILLLTLLGILTAEVLGRRNGVHIGVSLDGLQQSIDANDLITAGNALDMVQLMFGAIVCIVLFFVLIFYLLGALYDDRRDRSVLFWKSLPVTDTATVASKALSALFVAPLISFAIATAAYLVFLVLMTLWMALHGINMLPAIGAAHPFAMFARLLLTIPVDAMWAIPTVGWLLFWSAFARSKPFMWAVLLPLLAVFLNYWLGVLGLPNVDSLVTLKQVVGRLLLGIMPGGWMGDSPLALRGFNDANVLGALAPERVLSALGRASTWVGAAAGIALMAGATWLRGRRIEVNA